MADTISQIEAGQANLEDKLLTELQRLGKQELPENYAPLDPNIETELKLSLDALHSVLDNSGDFSNLSLETDQHENTRTRMQNLASLLNRKIPTAFIGSTFREARLLKIKPEDPLFASRILEILNKQVILHHVEGQSIEQVMKGRAEFDAKELSGSPAMPEQRRNIAQTPEEIRRKLAQKSTSSTGALTFVARDLDEAQPVTPARKPEQENAQTIAQTPEEIRRKLAEKQSASKGKAVFGARDIEPDQPQVKTPEASTKPTTPTPPTSAPLKAVFGAKDIEPLSEAIQRQENKKKEPEKTSGKASFLARDLSDPKP